MKVLVACEYSGRVREAFRMRGHNAISCDLLPAEDGSQFHYQGDLFDIIRQFAGNGLFTSEGEIWLRQRRLMQPAFHRRRIAGFGKIMTGRTLDMLAQREQRADPGQPLDVADELTALTMAIIYLLPRLTNVIPSTLAAILLVGLNRYRKLSGGSHPRSGPGS
jgi:cytochrome P450